MSIQKFHHHNDKWNLDGRVLYDAVWQSNWHRLVTKLDSWYAMPQGSVGRRFVEILAEEWQGVLDRSWNSDIPLRSGTVSNVGWTYEKRGFMPA